MCVYLQTNDLVKHDTGYKDLSGGADLRYVNKFVSFTCIDHFSKQYLKYSVVLYTN